MQPVHPSESSTLWKRGAHISQLDGVRGLAILIVTIYRFSKEIPTDSTVGKFLHAVFALGDRGVDLFFVLSGFLITGILVDAKGNSRYFTNFFARRSLRIFPLYFLSLMMLLAISNWSLAFRGAFDQAASNQIFLWTYLTNVKMSLEGAWCFGYLDHFWSLAVEEHFYFLWPVVIFFCTTKNALRLAILLAATSAASRTLFAAVSSNGVAPDVLSIFRFDALLIGSSLALVARQPGGLKILKKPVVVLIPICIIAGLVLSIAEKRVFAVGHTIWPVIWAGMLVWLLTSKSNGGIRKFFDAPVLRKLGKYSYALYVFQSPLIPLTAGVISASSIATWTGNSVVAHLIYVATMSLLSFGAALLSWHFVEKHFLGLKRFFPSSGKSIPVPESTALGASAKAAT